MKTILIILIGAVILSCNAGPPVRIYNGNLKHIWIRFSGCVVSVALNSLQRNAALTTLPEDFIVDSVNSFVPELKFHTKMFLPRSRSGYMMPAEKWTRYYLDSLVAEWQSICRNSLKQEDSVSRTETFLKIVPVKLVNSDGIYSCSYLLQMQAMDNSYQAENYFTMNWDTKRNREMKFEEFVCMNTLTDTLWLIKQLKERADSSLKDVTDLKKMDWCWLNKENISVNFDTASIPLNLIWLRKRGALAEN